MDPMSHQQDCWSYGEAEARLATMENHLMVLDTPLDPAYSSHNGPSDAPYPYQSFPVDEMYATVPSANHDHGPGAQFGTVLPPDMEEMNHATIIQIFPSADGGHGLGVQSGIVYEMQLYPEGTLAAPAIAPTAQASCRGICQYPNNTGSGSCGFQLTCQIPAISAHFKSVHGIKNINEFERIVCKWEGCLAERSRKNFSRHIQEYHLGHSRTWGCPPN